MPPWLSELRSALHQNRRQRTVQVATADPKVGPTVRTVILRRVEDDGTLVFYTDTRSEKVAQLWVDDRVEVHTWWTKGRVQFRLRGRAELSVDDEDPIRRELWDLIGEEDLVRFHGPPPGTSLAGAESVGSAPLDGIPETFAVVRVRPSRVDVLRLSPERHERERHDQTDDGWVSIATQP